MGGLTLLRRLERLVFLAVLCRYVTWVYRIGPKVAFKKLLGSVLSVAQKSLPGVNSIVEHELRKEVSNKE